MLQTKAFIGVVVTFAWCALTVRVLAQDIGATNLGDYLREGGFSQSQGQDPEMRKLAALYDQGAAAYRNKQYDRAISCFTALLKTNPESRIAAVIYVARAQTSFAKTEFKKAIADASEAIRLDRRLPIAYNTRGTAYGNMGDMTKAISDFDMAIRLDPHFTQAQYNRAIAQQHKNKR